MRGLVEVVPALSWVCDKNKILFLRSLFENLNIFLMKIIVQVSEMIVGKDQNLVITVLNELFSCDC